MDASSEISRQLYTTIPTVMRALRTELRSEAKGELTVPQLRVLANLNHGVEDATGLAEGLGVSLPAMSKMLDGLQLRGLIRRTPHRVDRRKAKVVLTRKGKVLFDSSVRKARKTFRAKIQKLPAQQRRELHRGLIVLDELFQS